MTTPTAGPWRFDDDAFLPEDWCIDAPITAGGNVIAAALTYPGRSLAQARADALLMARTPAMYALVREMAEYTGEAHDKSVFENIVREMGEKARAVLAAA